MLLGGLAAYFMLQDMNHLIPSLLGLCRSQHDLDVGIPI